MLNVAEVAEKWQLSTRQCCQLSSVTNLSHVRRALRGFATDRWSLYEFKTIIKLECGPMPNVMAALLNIGGALCSTLQSLAHAHY